MYTIWLIRLSISRILFNFFGYLSPALNSTKAIVNKDEEGIREYLTYWCVFGLLLYVEFLLNFFSIVRSWPPETRVLFILWLTLPQFQGAFRIYSFVLQPYFEKYEDEIDKQIDSISRKSVKIAHRHLQTILWQVFLAPQDGLFTSALSFSSLSSNQLIKSFLYQREEKVLGDITENIEPETQQISYEKRSTSQSLSRQLLESFTDMLLDGIYADVRHSRSDIPDIDMQVCKVSLVLGNYYLELVQQALDDIEKQDTEGEAEGKDVEGDREGGMKTTWRSSKRIVDEYIGDSKYNQDINEDSKHFGNDFNRDHKSDRDEHLGESKGDKGYIGDDKDYPRIPVVQSQRTFLVPLFLVTEVLSDRFDSNLITVSFSSPSSSIFGRSFDSIRPLKEDILQTRIVYMKAEDAEEGDVLLAGMSVLCADSKKRATSTLSRAVHTLSKTALSIAFKQWNRFSIT
mmetsp:Transcript_3029/g.3167  ORF Transcript_3029/g.3167 Transcript_3029/m.3167 type:complete len:458 (+) Transcript_3029:177-1550(+)